MQSFYLAVTGMYFLYWMRFVKLLTTLSVNILISFHFSIASSENALSTRQITYITYIKRNTLNKMPPRTASMFSFVLQLTFLS